MGSSRIRFSSIKAAALAAFLVAVIIGVIAFAEAWAVDAKCFSSFARSQFPKWLGCAIAQHENLAGGLIAAAGALFAGYLAWTAVREQIDVDRSMLRQARIARAEDDLEKCQKRHDAIRRAIDFHAPYVAAFAEATGSGGDHWILALLRLGDDGTLARNYYDELPPYYERLSGPVERMRGIYKKYRDDCATPNVDPVGIRQAADAPTADAARSLLDGVRSFEDAVAPAETRVRAAENALAAARAP